MDIMSPDDNAIPLAFVELSFTFLTFIFDLVTGVVLPAVLTPLFQAIFSIFTGGDMMMGG